MADGIPLQEDCDMDDPEQALLWALVDLPTPGAAGPSVGGFTIDKRTGKAWSKALFERGVRLVPEKQELFYHPPATDSWWGASAGEWLNYPPSSDGVDDVLSKMSAAQRAQLRDRLDALEGGE